MAKLIDLFPIPFMISRGQVKPGLVERLRERTLASHVQSNARTGLLSHTEMVDPQSEPLFLEVVDAVMPEIDAFGEHLLGDTFNWTVKEIWTNVLEPGGSQFMHTHANSFVSGIVYLSRPHPSTRTIFSRGAGGSDFVFKHDVAEGKAGKYNAERWMVPEVDPGDLVLYPSYLLHGVPPNEGGQRITVAFNAIPDSLDSLGYKIRFSP